MTTKKAGLDFEKILNSQINIIKRYFNLAERQNSMQRGLGVEISANNLMLLLNCIQNG